MGEDSSTRRPTLETIRSMICIKWPFLEGEARELKLAGTFDVNPIVAIDQDVGDSWDPSIVVRAAPSRNSRREFPGQAAFALATMVCY